VRHLKEALRNQEGPGIGLMPLVPIPREGEGNPENACLPHLSPPASLVKEE
jgi:hypothetical protein